MHKGFSLIEVIVTVSIFAMALVLLTVMIINIYRVYGFNFKQNTAINEARKGIEVMVKEIRGARYGEDGSYPVKEAGNSQFIFYSDINRDSRIERVRYFLEGTNLKKGVIVPTGDPPQYVLSNEKITILSAYVRNATTPVFIYYNGDWPTDTIHNPLPTLTRLTETKLMHVYLQVNVDPNRPPNNFQLESDVQIRNLKTNL
jgi:prepilin-type N-terminal cleavage/methylation domain-containing protein